MDQPSETIGCGPVRLRRWHAGDAEVAYRVVTDALEHLRPWMPWAASYDRDQAARFIARSQEDWQSGKAYQYAITTGGAVVGSVGLMRRIGPGGLEIGYWLHPAHTGRGLVTAAVAGLVREAFALPGVDRVEIIHDLANTRSAGVPRRLGFTEVERRGRRPQLPAAPAESGIEVVWRLTRHDTVAG